MGCTERGNTRCLPHFLTPARVSLLTNRERQLAQDDPEAFLTKPPLPVTIEEFQRAPALASKQPALESAGFPDTVQAFP